MISCDHKQVNSVHRGETATVEIAGYGYWVQLPGCRAAGSTNATAR